MKTEIEIKEKLKEVESNPLLLLENFTIDENAPVALMQLDLESTLKTLKWVLS